MRLSEHFTLEEMTVTQVRGLDNSCPADLLVNLEKTCEFMEQIRSVLGRPVTVTSGYRSPLVNKIVGGSSSSDHKNALACDFICPQFGSPLEVVKAIKRSGLKLDQCIYEGTWVHVGIGSRMRQQFIGLPVGEVIA